MEKASFDKPTIAAGEKTGTSENGTSNDVGLLWPPNGAAPALVAAYFIKGSPDGTIRDAARLTLVLLLLQLGPFDAATP
jgi:hypothetical protein